MEKKSKLHRGEIIRKKISSNMNKLNGMTFKIADSLDELEAAFKIGHDVYVEKEYMDPDPSGLRVSIYNALPKTTTFIGRNNGDVLLTMTLFPDSSSGLPMDSIYKKEFYQLRNEGRYIAEVGCLASHPVCRENNPTIPIYLNKILFKYAKEHLKLDDIVIAINPKHKLFYEHVMLFEKLGDIKNYSYVKNNPAIAMRLNLHDNEEKYRQVYQGRPVDRDLYDFYFVSKSECISLPEKKEPLVVMNNELLSYFFEKKTNIFNEVDKKIVDLIKAQYPLIKITLKR